MADTKLINMKIDARDVQVPAGTLVIEAARRLGIEVPSFCYYPGLSLQAACRMCLVEVEEAPKMQTSIRQFKSLKILHTRFRFIERIDSATILIEFLNEF